MSDEKIRATAYSAAGYRFLQRMIEIEQEKEQANLERAAVLRKMGVVLWHPNDGWVERDEKGALVSLNPTYPLFGGVKAVRKGELVAIGGDWADRKPTVLCRVGGITGMSIVGRLLLEVEGVIDWRAGGVLRRVER